MFDRERSRANNCKISSRYHPNETSTYFSEICLPRTSRPSIILRGELSRRLASPRKDDRTTPHPKGEESRLQEEDTGERKCLPFNMGNHPCTLLRLTVFTLSILLPRHNRTSSSERPKCSLRQKIANLLIFLRSGRLRRHDYSSTDPVLRERPLSAFIKQVLHFSQRWEKRQGCRYVSKREVLISRSLNISSRLAEVPPSNVNVGPPSNV